MCERLCVETPPPLAELRVNPVFAAPAESLHQPFDFETVARSVRAARCKADVLLLLNLCRLFYLTTVIF